MNNEYLFNQQVKVELVIFDPSEISTLLDIYEHEIIQCILNNEFELVEEHLSNMFFSIVNKKDVNHLLILKSFYIMFICDVFHLIRLKELTQAQYYFYPFALISTIQQWKETSQFLSSIPWIIQKIREMLDPLHYAPHYSGLVVQTITLIHTHLKHPDLSVKWLAGQLNVTPSHLSYVFSQQSGNSLSSFINETKIKAIIYDIEYSNISLKKIAEMYNYTSYSNFIRALKKHSGMTPTQLKKSFIGIPVERKTING